MCPGLCDLTVRVRYGEAITTHKHSPVPSSMMTTPLYSLLQQGQTLAIVPDNAKSSSSHSSRRVTFACHPSSPSQRSRCSNREERWSSSSPSSMPCRKPQRPGSFMEMADILPPLTRTTPGRDDSGLQQIIDSPPDDGDKLSERY